MKSNKGFTLIELLVVIAIIGLLATVVMTSLNSARKKGRDTRRIEDINQLRSALEMYYDSNGSYPASLNDLATGTPRFLSVVPTDPQTGNQYSYVPSANSNATDYVLYTALETNHKALQSDVDGTVNMNGTNVDCGTATNDTVYCVRP